MPHRPLIVRILFGASLASIRILLFVERWIVNAPADRAGASPPQPVTPGET